MTYQPSLNTLLAILQQSEYDIKTVKKWFKQRNRANAKQFQNLQPDQWTLKLRLIASIARILFFLPLLNRIELALLSVSFPQYLVTQYILWKARTKLRSAQQKGLMVIAIAGSYGKTSTKQWLHHLLSSQTSVLHTKKSINTPLGIAHTILNDLSPAHKICIIELGEYYQGDIQELAQFIQPNYGIITPIGRQHLERMGSINAIANTIGELLTYFEQQSNQTKKSLNTVDTAQKQTKKSTLPVISALENKQFFNDRVQYYGQKNPSNTLQWAASLTHISKAGTEGVIHGINQEWKVFTPLYGLHQLTNMLPAFWLANEFSNSSIFIDFSKLAQSAANMPYITQRHEPHFSAHDVLILDNSYNTNPESFACSLKLLHQLKPTRSIVITLGFVELGSDAKDIHTELGKNLAQNADFVGIIDSINAQFIKQGFLKAGGKENHIIIEKTPELCMSALQKHVIAGSIVLFEGGYREVLV